MTSPSFLLIDGCDFQSFPTGGQLTSAQNFMRALGEQVGLVGFVTDDAPVGRWSKRKLLGAEFWFYGVCRQAVGSSKPLVPRRFSFYRHLKAQGAGILSLGCRNVLLQAPESLLAVAGWGWSSICYRMAGTDNPLVSSRYGLGRLLAPYFQQAFLRQLEHVQVILASADERSINRFVSSTHGVISRKRIVQFPTRVDTGLFFPAPRREARTALGLPENDVIAVSVGRVNRNKGWRLLLDAFEYFCCFHAPARLIFVGDGEDRPALERSIAQRGCGERVWVSGTVTPDRVAAYMNAADLFVSGSAGEGWSLAMMEALACAKPIVSTDVSGASAMIDNSLNGQIVKNRNPIAFAFAMDAALGLPDAAHWSLERAKPYALETLSRDLVDAWPALLSPGGSVAPNRISSGAMAPLPSELRGV